MWWLSSLTWYLLGTVGFLLLAYTYHMSKHHGLLKKLGIPTPTVWPIFGTLFSSTKVGLFQYHVDAFRKYREHKAYGGYFGRVPVIFPRDLDIIRDICVKHANVFTNRNTFDIQERLDHALTNLKDDHWKRVRSTISPTFSSGKLKRMVPLVQGKADRLVNYLKEHQESNRELELKDVLSKYTMDCIAATGFGAEIDSFADSDNRFTQEGKKMIAGTNNAGFVGLFCDFLWPVIKRVTSIVPNDSLDFFQAFVDQVMAERKSEVGGAGSDAKSRRSDFLQLVMEAMEEQGQDGGQRGSVEGKEEGKKPLSYLELQGQALIFIFAGYDTQSTTMAFTSYLLASNPECCQKVQEEIDQVLKGAKPNNENVQELPYLDQCINEALRMYPPGFLTDRVASETIEIQGLTIPKGVLVLMPICGIHNDPELYPEPEKFKPERFTPEEKAKRHPYAHLPFGMGPRNCIGMRLAMLILKIGLASVLQVMTPVLCQKSVNPIELKAVVVEAKDGLWVKMEPRPRK